MTHNFCDFFPWWLVYVSCVFGRSNGWKSWSMLLSFMSKCWIWLIPSSTLILINIKFNFYDKENKTYTQLSVQLLSHVQLFVTPWTAACQAFLSITNSLSLLKLMSIESVMPSSHLILLCHPLLLLPPIFPSIRVFSNESVLHIRWPKYWSFSFSISSFQWIFRTDFL